MANEKVFQSRIQLKHDIEENWSKATNFIPKVGEIIIYDIDENNSIARFKIGDGITNVNSLPFVSHHEVISYLPQDLTEEQKAQARENIGAGESQIQADWNQSDETAVDYIKNRTHYEGEEEVAVITATFTSDGSYYKYTMSDDNNEPTVFRDLVENRSTVKIRVNDSDFVLTSNGFSDGYYRLRYDGYYTIENYIGGNTGRDLHFHPSALGLSEDEDSYTVYIYDTQTVLKQLDEKFIPDTIARTSNLVQPDWNQNDENAPGYIANRTHYIDAINGTIVPNDTYFISGTQGVTINAKKDDFKMPVVGQTYQITYGDIVTTKVAYSEDIGNNAVWLGENYNEFKMRFSFNEISSKVEVYIETTSTGQKIISITGPYLNKIYQLDEKYIPTATNNDIIQMLIDTEMISPATDEFSNLLTDENDSILVY